MVRNKKTISKNGKICNSCGGENSSSAKTCKECGRSKFAPSWVKAKRIVNRYVSVEITNTNPQFGEELPRISLSKWWPGGGSSTFHIPSMSQWEKIAEIIETDLCPILGWKSSKAIAATIEDNISKGKAPERGLSELFAKEPDVASQVLSALNKNSKAGSDITQVMELLEKVAEASQNANAGFRETCLSVMAKLPSQKHRALQELDELLKNWSLQTVTTVAQQIRARLDTIALFEKQVLDERTFEISGDNSIHRILERAMWLVDERYWLLHSNTTLLKQIGNEMSKIDKRRYGKQRPDFVCGTYGEKLIILELKRPSHPLDIDDLNQLETYVTVAEKYHKARSYEAYLVGSKKNDELIRRLKHRSNAFKVLTYSELIDETKKRYQEYLQAVEM